MKNLFLKSNNVNKRVVLEEIKNNQPLTRTRLGQLTGVRMATISKCVGDLIKQGWIIEENRKPSSKRPRNVMLGINPDKGFFVGVEFDPESIIGVVTDMKGVVKKKLKRAVRPTKGKEAIITGLISLIRDLIVHLDHKKILSIGISAQGIIDTRKGICIFYSHIKDWENVPLGQIINQEFNLPVVVENSAPMKVFAENTMGVGRGVNNLVFIEYGPPGIGAGMIFNGVLLRGGADNSGEIGHTVLEPDGPICNCGMTGCLEALASRSVLENQAVRSIRGGANSMVNELAGGNLENVTAEIVFEAARRGDNLCLNLIDNAAGYLGMAIANLINLLNPEMVVLDPQFAKVADLFLPPTQRTIARHTLHRLVKNVKIELSQLGEEIGALGICAFLIEEVMRCINHVCEQEARED